MKFYLTFGGGWCSIWICRGGFFSEKGVVLWFFAGGVWAGRVLFCYVNDCFYEQIVTGLWAFGSLTIQHIVRGQQMHILEEAFRSTDPVGPAYGCTVNWSGCRL